MPTAPTTVFVNGAVFRADAARSWASALAVRDGQIVAVGGDADVAPFTALADEVIDLDGRLITPGFVDAHVHPVSGGLERIRCDLTGADTGDAYFELIAGFAAGSSDTWIRGGGWAMAAFPAGRPTREQLDAVVADRPVYLPNRDHHSAWVNGRALELAGITAATGDPVDGRIERDATGRPTGLLHEGAMELIARHVPADTQDDLAAGLRASQKYLHSLGVTAWQDAMVFSADPESSTHRTYLRAQAEGWLTARVAGALWWDRAQPADLAAEVTRLAGLRAQARQAGQRYSLDHVKIMQDGVVETYTAALLEPYLDRCGHAGGNRGISFQEPELLRAIVGALDAAGFGVHFHALGDRAVRDVLDALEAARAANGTADRRHHLAHLQVVDPADRPRFRALGATANVQALWACHEPQMDELTIPFLGSARADAQYPFGDLLRNGAQLAMGSDWPVSTPDPLAALHVAVNRIAPDTPAGTPPLAADQAIPLGAALAAYTAGSAWVCRLDDVAGTLAAGRPADLVVLDRNPFDGPVHDIAATRVQRTYVAGNLLHCAD